MSDQVRIECPKCRWEPDGLAHWGCTCGHSWNTFDTKAKCPTCGIQWEDTYCPGCRQASKHELWYTSEEKRPEPVITGSPELLKRKTIIENRLITSGIKNSRITYLPYLEFSEEDFQTPYEVGCRLLILFAVSYVAGNLDDKGFVEDWLKSTLLWDKLSDREKAFFEETDTITRRALMDFSWQMEGCIVLAWAVNLIPDLPDPGTELSADETDELIAKLPIAQDPNIFLSNLNFRDKEAIFIENITNEMITSHLRDLMISGKKQQYAINPSISFERHRALNWLRKFSGVSDWDETDTST